jgi:hypothetical protein
MKFTCLVCGYPEMKYPPADHNICSCCGTHFEYDDFETTHAELRRRWIDEGMQWWSNYTPQPANWNPTQQIRDLEDSQ